MNNLYYYIKEDSVMLDNYFRVNSIDGVSVNVNKDCNAKGRELKQSIKEDGNSFEEVLSNVTNGHLPRNVQGRTLDDMLASAEKCLAPKYKDDTPFSISELEKESSPILVVGTGDAKASSTDCVFIDKSLADILLNYL